mgnify:CR=1 FL=1
MDKSGYDLTELYDSDNTFSSFSQLISGKTSYKTVKEKKKETILCSQCKFQLKGKEKFCPECGWKVDFSQPAANPQPEAPKSL